MPKEKVKAVYAVVKPEDANGEPQVVSIEFAGKSEKAIVTELRTLGVRAPREEGGFAIWIDPRRITDIRVEFA